MKQGLGTLCNLLLSARHAMLYSYLPHSHETKISTSSLAFGNKYNKLGESIDCAFIFCLSTKLQLI